MWRSKCFLSPPNLPGSPQAPPLFHHVLPFHAPAVRPCARRGGGRCHIPLLCNLIHNLTAWSRHSVAFPTQTLCTSKPRVQHLQAGGLANLERPAFPLRCHTLTSPVMHRSPKDYFPLFTFYHSNDFFFTLSHSRGEGRHSLGGAKRGGAAWR